MPALAGSKQNTRCGLGGERAMAKGNTPLAPSGVATAAQLMGTADQLAIPRLDGVSLQYHYSAGDSASIALARTLVQLDLAAPEDWEAANRDPGAYVLMTIARWIAAHGGQAISRRFDLYTTVSSCLDEYSARNEENPDGSRLYLTVDPDRSGFVVLGPTLELLERAHPGLPATFYSLFSGALNKWVRVYDYREAEERASLMREWIEGEADQDEYEIPDVEGCIPACIKRRQLGRRALRELRRKVKGREVAALLDALVELARVSGLAERPALTDEMREELCDSNPPLPSLLVVFAEGDLIEAAFDDEGQTTMEVTPEPSVIIPLNAHEPASVRQAFHTFGILCDSLAAASRIIDRMPGNERWVIQR